MRDADACGWGAGQAQMVSFHIMGSARMGGSPADSVCDPTGQVWDARLYVLDGSAFPTASGVNPMVTIEALAHMNARALAAKLGALAPADAVVVGAGPERARGGDRAGAGGAASRVLEGEETIGGGCRSAELTLPGFVHDTCSTVHPLALASPFFRTLPLDEHGLELVHPQVPLAHPLDDGTAAVLERSVEETAAGSARTARLPAPVRAARPRRGDAVRRPAAARCARRATRSCWPASASRAAPARRARALPLHGRARPRAPRRLLRALDAAARAPVSAAFGIVLALTAHAVGWPVARGGSQRLADALAAHLR